MAVHTMYFSCSTVWIVGCMWIRQGCRCSNHVFVQSRRFLLLYSLPGRISKCPVALKKFVSALAESINGKSTKAVILQNKDGNPKNTGKRWICISSWLWVAEDESNIRSINQNADLLNANTKLKRFICEDNRSHEEDVDQKTSSVQMEDENQRSVSLWSGIIWQKQLKIYTTLIHTTAGGQYSWRRTLLETHTTKNLYSLAIEVSARTEGCKTQPSLHFVGWCCRHTPTQPKGIEGLCDLLGPHIH